MYKKKQILLQGKKISRKWPANITEQDTHLFKNEKEVHLSTVEIFFYENCLVNLSGIVFKNLKTEKELLIWEKHQKNFNALYLVKQYFKNRLLSIPDKNYFLCHDYWSDGYFHWVCEALPRIMLVEKNLKDENSSLLLPERYKNKFQYETLSIFNNIHITWLPEKCIVKCKKLISPNRIAPSGSNNPELISELKEKIVSHFGQAKFRGKNIYVSRNKAKRRKVTNETALINLLLKYNFEIICFEDYSFSDQVKIIQSAKNLISIHGANLTNLMFLPKNANVLELRRNEDDANNYYYALADASGVNYYYQLCSSTQITEAGNNFNLHVDIGVLEQNIKLMLAN